MSTPVGSDPGPPKSRSSWIPRRLRERDWFWPKAVWLGIRWVGAIFVHPLSAAASWFIVFLTICGVVIALHPNALLVFLFLVVALLLIVGRGARLKWEQDRRSADIPGDTSPATHIDTYHAHGPTFVVTPDLLSQIGALEAKPTAAGAGAVGPEPKQEPQVEVGQADDRMDGPGYENPGR